MRKKKSFAIPAATATVEKLSHDGRGIAYIDEKITFIEGALPGETVDFEYTRKRGQYDEGRCTDIKTPSEHRIEATCPHFGQCGGCSLQYMDKQSQLNLKQDTLLEQLSHFGKLSPEEVLEPMTGPDYHYRSKARLGVKYVVKKDKVLVGFREKNSRYLADLSQCPVLAPQAEALINPLSELIYKLSNRDQIPQIEVAVTDKVTALVMRHMSAFTEQDETLLKEFCSQWPVYLYLQPKGPDTITRFWPVEADPKPLAYQLAEFGLELEFFATDFTQVNQQINPKMVQQAVSFLDLNKDETVLDLFCGLGNFTLALATQAKSVVGVEGSEAMVQRAQHNAKLNSLENTAFYAADLTQPIADQAFAKQNYDKLLLDPARSGAKEVLTQMDLKSVKKIVYVSCNPATLARDAGLLTQEKGFKLTKAGIIDMFPQTKHVESIAVFER